MNKALITCPGTDADSNILKIYRMLDRTNGDSTVWIFPTSSLYLILYLRVWCELEDSLVNQCYSVLSCSSSRDNTNSGEIVVLPSRHDYP